MTKSIGLTRPEQREAFDNAARLVREDVDGDLIEAETWAGDLPDGEIVRIVCSAYSGDIVPRKVDRFDHGGP